ncbi:hypothetical protein [Phenylobacterium sp.]|uniref:hypothetical protein n=1 Tax=Phenylobacterium sp. TaxID=1871053 RepID=UPI0035622FFE
MAQAAVLTSIDGRPDPGRIAGLLAAGGDERIVLDPQTGLNRYGCAAAPHDGLAAFGSSTASVISGSAYDAAARAAARITAGPADAYAQEMTGLRRRLAALCGLPEAAAGDLILAASGTDLHLIAATLASDGRRPLTALLAAPAETGRGVPDAVRGRRFAALTPHGRAGDAGEPLAGAVCGEAIGIPVREPSGVPRPTEAVDADFERACALAIEGGARVLLSLVDVSKTGLVAPSPDCASRLKARFAGAVSVLVDACQFRISNATLADYLRRDFLVAVTGSKFLGGPAFSGALLVPPGEAEALRHRALLPALGDYCGRQDWPEAWLGRRLLPDRPNPGMMLRWEAALHELAAFRSLPEDSVAGFLAAFGAAVSQAMGEAGNLEPLPAPLLRRTAPGAWDAQQTIFSFLPLGRRGPPSPEQTQALHRGLMRAASPVHLGQAVSVGVRDGKPLTALRLSLSARLIVEALTTPNGGARVIARARGALAAAAALAAPL